MAALQQILGSGWLPAPAAMCTLLQTVEMESWITPGWMFVCILFGPIGAAYFFYGNKQKRWVYLVAGLLMVVAIVAIHNALLLLLAGIVVALLPHVLIRLGVDF